MPLITQPTEAKISPSNKPPVSLEARPVYATGAIGNSADQYGGTTVGSNASTSYATILNVTGEGVIQRLFWDSSQLAGTSGLGLKVTIDDVLVYDAIITQANNTAYALIGSVSQSGLPSAHTTESKVPFYKNFKIEARGNGINESEVCWQYYLTA